MPDPMTTTDPKLIEPALWQRRRLHPLASAPAGSIPRWQECSAREATGHFEREPGYEYRPLYTAAAINEATHQWQDIATAPRDGSHIIAGRFGRSNELCWVKHSRWITAAEAAENEGQGFDAEDYEDGWTDGNDDWECCYPTHWQPLPSPPAIEAKESGQ